MLIFYLSGVIVAMWLSGILVKIDENNGEEIEPGMFGCVSCLSWIAVITLIVRYKKEFIGFFKYKYQ